MISPTLSPSAYSYLNPLVSLSTVTPFTFPTNNPFSASRMISVASIIGFILLLRELYFHFVSVNCLRPPYYTLSNLFRAIHITFYLSLIFDTLESGRNYRYTYFAWARLIILLYVLSTCLIDPKVNPDNRFPPFL